MLPSKLAFVDVETTGLDAKSGRIIEIGILRVENNQLIETFSSLINPETDVDPFSLTLTGISQHDIEKAPTFREVMKDVYQLLENSVFVAHNVEFDYGFIENEFKRNHKKYVTQRICTVKLFRQLYPNSYRHNLDALIERFGFDCENRHRAFADAQVLWEFYSRLHRTIPQDDLEKAIQKSSFGKAFDALAKG